MSLKFAVGDLTIHRIIEQETTFLPALEMFPGLTPDLLAENRAWMQKAGALDAQDMLILCFQSYVGEDAAPHHSGRQLHRQRQAAAAAPEVEHEDRRQLYARAGGGGFSVGDIDFVMCTHLHVDHVGWNTRLENGRWVPTFPNARYVFGEERIRLLERTACEDGGAAVRRQRVAGRRGQAGRDRAQRLCDRRSRPHCCRRRATRRVTSPSPSAAAKTLRSSAAI